MESWSAWSAWAYDETRDMMYRYRQNLMDGQLDYDWDSEYNVTPRESGDVNALADGLQNVELSPSSSYETQNQGYALSRSGHKEKSSSKSSKHKSSSKEKAKEKSSKHHSHDKGSSHHKGHGSSSSSAANQGRGSSSTTPQQGYDQSQDSYDPRTQQYYGSESYSTEDSTYSSLPGSSYSTSAHDAQALAYGNAAAGPSDYSTSAYAYEQDDDGTSTPRNHISAEDDPVEQMDPRYKIERSNRFQPGEIFKIYWSEPQGAGDSGKHPSVSGRHEQQNRFGAKFYVGFRRFLIIANDLGHCTCVPILTYGGKGCKKSGVKPAKHGIVYETGQKARRVDGEPKLGFHPVQVRLNDETEKLSKESRANYSKLVTVEHNVKVFFIGSIIPESWDIVEDAVNQCWGQKVHHRKP